MKKTKILAMAAVVLMTTGCGMGTMGTMGTGSTGTATNGTTSTTGSVLGSVLNDMLTGGTISNVITSVIGAQKVTQQNLIGTWRYSGPGCAFTSEQLLAKAGGEVAAAQIKQKMLPTYNTLGFSSSNTYVTFNEDGTFAASIDGKPFQGKYTFDASTCKVSMQGLLLNLNCYAKRNANGIALLFEAKKLLTVLQTLAVLSGNQTAQTIGDLSKNYDGVRLGFDFTK